MTRPTQEANSARTVAMVTLGCPKNRVDSEVMLGRLQAEGYSLVEDPALASTVIVNTCGFIEAAQQESIDTILDLAALKGEGLKRLLVAGCMVNRFGEELRAEIPEIDDFVSLDELDQTANLVGLGRGGSLPIGGASVRTFDHLSPRVLTTSGYSYMKVAEGCDNPCTFCAIPLWRGRFRSRSVGSLIEEARRFDAAGVQELCLVAQDTTRYGEDLGLGRGGLRQLIEILLQETAIPWIRFLYAYPTTLDRGLFDLMAEQDRFCSYVDMPLQHSHRDVLRAMRRGGDGESYLGILEEARSKVPEISLRSTFIVGFPGETDEHFEDLLDFIAEARLDHVGGFTYSPEEGTPAADLGARVPAEVAQERLSRLLECQRPHSRASRQRLVGRELTALIEGVCDESEYLLQGRHAGMAPDIDGRLLLADGTAPAGSLARVRIVEAFDDDIVGHILAPITAGA